VDSTKSGMLGRALGYLGLSRKTPLEEPQDAPPVEEAKDVVRDELETSVPDLAISRTQPATTIPTILKSPNRSFTKSAKRKHASDAERQDLYEVPTETASHDSDPEDPPTNRPAKRARQNVRAKTPLTIPKTSKGRIPLQHPRQTRANSTDEADQVETTPDVRTAASVNESGDSAVVEQLIPRKRGRPRKNKGSDSRAIGETAISPEKIVSADHAMSTSGVAANRQGAVPQTSEDVDGGVSKILLNPSPVRVVRQPSRPPAPIAQQQKVLKTRNGAKINGLQEISDDEDGQFVRENDEEESADDSDSMEIEEEQALANRATNEARRTPFDPKVIEKMWETSKHVGHKFDAEEGWSEGGRVEKIWTGPGKRMIRELKLLTSSYERLQQAKMPRDKNAFHDAHKAVEKSLNILSVETEAVVMVRFGPDFDDKKKRAILTDLYFNVIPKCIHALKTAVAVYNIRGSMETDALGEILKLTDFLYDLANTAVTQPKEIQPKRVGSVSYQISQPTRSVLPDVRSLQKKILVELNFRERETNRAKQEQERPERERRLLEEQRREEAEIRRKRAERRRMQGESWWTVRNNHLPGLWNRALQTEIARLEATRKGKGRQESVELGYPRVNRAESRRANSEESRHGVERVSVFPANNVKANSSMSSLSKEDTLVFIDCMRYEQGKTISYQTFCLNLMTCRCR